jgi:HAE1 family hydrophobic/amphiphilic exporter-1
MREVLIQANTDGRPAGDIGVDVKKLQDSIKLPAGYHFETEGANKDMAESAGYAATALLLAIIFIYMVLGSQFNSFLYPVAIMTSLPLSLIGVFLALFIFQSTLNLFSIIGIVMLMGLVTKNAILLIDFIKEAVARGEEPYSCYFHGRPYPFTSDFNDHDGDGDGDDAFSFRFGRWWQNNVRQWLMRLLAVLLLQLY